MTTADFEKWWIDLLVRFPSVDSWLVKIALDDETQRRLLRNWIVAFQDVSLVDAVEVNLKMQTGDLPWVGDFDRDIEKLPQHVRRLARQLAYKNNRAAEPDEPRRPSSFPAGKILRRILQLTDKGVSSAEAKAIVLAELPVGNPTWEPRYNCRICFDVGFITVASQSALNAIIDETFERCNHRTGAMLCSCKGHLPQNQHRPRAVYDPALDFKVEDDSWGQVEVDRFREWVEFKRNEYWNSKRDPAFDTFNQREFSK